MLKVWIKADEEIFLQYDKKLAWKVKMKCVFCDKYASNFSHTYLSGVKVKRKTESECFSGLNFKQIIGSLSADIRRENVIIDIYTLTTNYFIWHGEVSLNKANILKTCCHWSFNHKIWFRLSNFMTSFLTWSAFKEATLIEI